MARTPDFDPKRILVVLLGGASDQVLAQEAGYRVHAYRRRCAHAGHIALGRHQAATNPAYGFSDLVIQGTAPGISCYRRSCLGLFALD